MRSRSSHAHRGKVNIEQRNARERGNITEESNARQGIIIATIILGIVCKMRGDGVIH